MSFRVRPFRTSIELRNGDSTEVSGEIVDGVFVVTFFGIPYRLATLQAGRDALSEKEGRYGKYGPFAEIEECHIPLGDGFMLRALRWSASESEIGFWRQDVAMRDEMIRQGYDPERNNLIVPNGSGISVYFTSLGTLNGSAALYEPLSSL